MRSRGLAVAFALWLLPAQFAAAATEFQAAAHPAAISASQLGNHVFTVEGGNKLTCAKASFGGELSQPGETVDVAPSYTECTAFGFAATVAMEGCLFKFHAGEESGESKFAGTMDVVCPEGKKIKVTAVTCEVQIGSQSGLGPIEYVNNPSSTPPDVTVKSAVNGFKYTKTADGFLCPLSGTGEKADGVYSGEALAKGSLDSEPVAVAVTQKLKTKLCKEEPKPNCKNAYPANTLIEATIDFPKTGNTTHFQLEQTAVICKKSVIAATTKEEENAPLRAKQLSVSLEKCETEQMVQCGKVEMKFAAGDSEIIASTLIAGRGWLFTPAATLVLECGKDASTLYCEYKAKSLALEFASGKELSTQQRQMERVEFMGEVGCSKHATWSGFHPIGTPNPAWVGN